MKKKVRRVLGDAMREAKPSTGGVRVAAYIRVSTEKGQQADSYETQERYYTDFLAAHADWVSAGIYADYAISGVSNEKRKGFQRLLRHCAEGQIDRVLCKSVSRFARNTADFIMALRILKDNHTTIFFEKENLDTAGAANEFILATLGAIAQEESRSISENLRWGMQKRYPQGETANKIIYGYRYAEGEYDATESGYRYRRIEIVPAEAAVVRRIFEEAAAGTPLIKIARGLNRDGVSAPVDAKKQSSSEQGVPRPVSLGWTGSKIGRLVRLERYAGDVLLQKTYSRDFMEKRSYRNDGALPQFYVKDHHAAIVTRPVFEAVQQIVTRRKMGAPRNVTARYPFSGRLVCPYCGCHYIRTNSKSNNPLWRCRAAHLRNDALSCPAQAVRETQLEGMFCNAVMARFGSVGNAVRDDAAAEQCIADLLDRLTFVHKGDCIERDRAFLMRLAETPMAVAADAVHKAAADARQTEKAKAQLAHMERYWEALEADYAERARAIAWLKGMPKGRCGGESFFDGLTAHVKAFALHITVHSPQKCAVRWFDDTETNVELPIQMDAKERKK